jgi:hypothetical protein
VDSEIRSQAAISAIDTPATVFSVNATRLSGAKAGWQHVKIRRSRSSSSGSALFRSIAASSNATCCSLARSAIRVEASGPAAPVAATDLGWGDARGVARGRARRVCATARVGQPRAFRSMPEGQPVLPEIRRAFMRRSPGGRCRDTTACPTRPITNIADPGFAAPLRSEIPLQHAHCRGRQALGSFRFTRTAIHIATASELPALGAGR